MESAREFTCIELFNIKPKTNISEEIQTITVGKKLGEGSFSKVYEYPANQDYIFKRTKILKMDKLEFKSLVLQIYINLTISDSINNPIPKIQSFGFIKPKQSEKPEELYIIMENAGKDITKHINENTLTVKDKLELFKKLVEAVDSLHKLGYLHRDLKLDNMTIKGDKVFLIDLGFLGYTNKIISIDEGTDLEKTAAQKVLNIKKIIDNNNFFKDNEKFNFLIVEEKEGKKTIFFKSDCHMNKDPNPPILNCDKYLGTQSFIAPELIGKFSQDEIKIGTKYSGNRSKIERYSSLMKKYYENPGILEGCSNLFGTDENMDPKINEKSDIFALGIMLLYILNTNNHGSKYPFVKDTDFIDKELYRVKTSCSLNKDKLKIDNIEKIFVSQIRDVFNSLEANLKNKLLTLIANIIIMDPKFRLETKDIITELDVILEMDFARPKVKPPVNPQDIKGGTRKRKNRKNRKKQRKSYKRTYKKRKRCRRKSNNCKK